MRRRPSARSVALAERLRTIHPVVWVQLRAVRPTLAKTMRVWVENDTRHNANRVMRDMRIAYRRLHARQEG